MKGPNCSVIDFKRVSAVGESRDSCCCCDKENVALSSIAHASCSQSPIALRHDAATAAAELEPLAFRGHWDDSAAFRVTNTGQTAYVTRTGKTQATISGGPLNSEYAFEQLHFHWASVDNAGCEHTLNGRGFAMEVHLVHYNTKYGSFERALAHADGLAVVGFVMAVGAHCPAFQTFAEAVSRVPEPEQNANLPGDCLSWLQREELCRRYFTYRGSLTTPPYTECVTWIVYDRPIFVGEGQVAAFRALRSPARARITNNVRPEQPAPKGHRVLYVPGHRRTAHLTSKL